MTTTSLKTIGMIGGMTWESTASYYRIANETVRDRLGALHSARILLASLDFQEISELQSAGRWADAAIILSRTAAELERAGAEVILICTNTMHLVFDEVQAAVQVPTLHIGDVTGQAIRADGLKKVGLLGTAFTMEKAFYRDRIASHGVEVIVPEPLDRKTVHDAIFHELALGICSEDTRNELREIIATLVKEGAQGIILGCTELELLVSQSDSPVPVFPTARLHAEAAVEFALK
ncbi:aspartate/glutamate racemase family protein [Leucobacter sp. UT-8R-CII-1-4]|uniref:aspartate/glutamate racemase family protein n=1 Tax=Leucobacter sp. UT-8R-CII-1-4 TaxID=3040075 RepID=UPI0024A9EFBB|nr:aspartate/glutamate racemase family protein [Leucobacter sp. UT-8R-CII-1-4]MDI6024273.1 aspartate/glutamate racemase family protein [Leucobacter sp. UT-8R-CII-1-4]